MDKQTLLKKLNDAIRTDKDLDFLHIKNLHMGLKRDVLRFEPGIESAPISVTITVEFQSNEYLTDERQSGRSTQQILRCPDDSIYYVPLSHPMEYYERIALKAGRTDIQFVRSFPILRSIRPRRIEVDHACDLSTKERDYIEYNNRRFPKCS